MKFIILTQYYPPEIGAPQTRLAAMVKVLESLGHQIEVVCAMPNYPTGQIFQDYKNRFYVCETWGNIKIHRIWLVGAKGSGLTRLLSFLTFMMTAFWGLLQCKKADFLFVNSVPLFLGVTGMVYKFFTKTPYIFNVSDLWPDSVVELGVLKNKFIYIFFLYLEKIIYSHANFVTGVTQGIVNTLINNKKIPQEKVLFLPNGVDLTEFSSQAKDMEIARKFNLDNKKILIYAGTTGLIHGCEIILKAAMELEQKLPDLMVVFVGGGSEWENLKNIVNGNNISNVKFIEFQPLAIVARLISLSFAGVVTVKKLSIFEGGRASKMFPIMGCAKPVIYCASGEGSEIIKNSNAGIIVEPENSQALALAIEDLYLNSEKASILGENARQCAEKNFDWNVLVQNWLDSLNFANSTPKRNI
jgi:colanic acid biosynthesis glycosyl transferase WcaI